MKKIKLLFGRVSFFRLSISKFNFEISIGEVATASSQRSLFYFSYTDIEGFDFSILWLKKVSLPLVQGARLIDVQYEPLEKKVYKRLSFNLFL
jgi:hypothetical protein